MPTPIAADRLGLTLATLVIVIGACVMLFARRYMTGVADREGFFRRLLALMAAVLVVVLARNVVLLGAAWVATGWLLARLIGHAAPWAPARASAALARSSFLLGDALFLLGLAGLSIGAHSTSVAAVAAAPASPLALALLAAGALTRSAILPASSWLMASMNAPTPVSAFMHAGLVNAGGFALARFAPALLQHPALLAAIFAAGAATSLIGGAVMRVKADVKGQLGASTMAQMGFMTMECGLGMFAAAIFHLCAHGIFKATLFLSAGGALEARHKAKPRPAALADLPGAALLGGLGLVTFQAASGHHVTGHAGDLLLLFAFMTAAETGLMAQRVGQERVGALAAGIGAVVPAAALYGIGLHMMEGWLAPVLPSAQPMLTPLHVVAGALFAAASLATAFRPAMPAALYPRLLGAFLPVNTVEARA